MTVLLYYTGVAVLALGIALLTPDRGSIFFILVGIGILLHTYLRALTDPR